MTTEPNRYVQPEISDARLNRLWVSLSERLEARPARSWRGVVLGLGLVATLGAGVFFTRSSQETPPAQAVLAGAELETASGSLRVTLVDGSSLALASRTQLTVQGNEPSSVALRLARGKLECDVTHRAGRAFTVTAADVEVRVIGTRFSVSTTAVADGERVEVSVLHGVVEIRSGRQPGIVARVGAGQRWLQQPEASSAVPVAPSAPSATSPPASSQAPLPSAAPSGAASPGVPTARELFERAGERRRAGDAAAAARAYEELLKLHPSDARASLSAFELGRLRMDRLGDAAGAIAALERAVALNVGPSFREDALARLVSVYAAQGSFAACGRARDRYLQSYPHGVHATAVGSRCGTH